MLNLTNAKGRDMDMYEIADKCGLELCMWGAEVISNTIPTNIPALDKHLNGGLRPGLHCVTGGPSSYKSALLLQVAYLAAVDGKDVLYLTDEISSAECWQRLASRKMQVDSLLKVDKREALAWSSIEDAAKKYSNSTDENDEDMLDWIGRKMAEALYAGVPQKDIDSGRELEKCRRLTISDMGPRISSSPTDENKWDGERTFEDRMWGNTRYLVSNIVRAAQDGWDYDFSGQCPQLVIIDAVNALRLYEYRYHKSRDEWCYRDVEREPRAKMEEIVETLDDFGRNNNIPIIGVFHGNRTGIAHHPSMGDFKETSAIEYRAVSAWELVRADDMRWSNHPKAPTAQQDSEPVGLYVLKSRGGQRTEQNKPIWLAADGAHNFISPLE